MLSTNSVFSNSRLWCKDIIWLVSTYLEVADLFEFVITLTASASSKGRGYVDFSWLWKELMFTRKPAHFERFHISNIFNTCFNDLERKFLRRIRVRCYSDDQERDLFFEFEMDKYEFFFCLCPLHFSFTNFACIYMNVRVSSPGCNPYSLSPFAQATVVFALQHFLDFNNRIEESAYKFHKYYLQQDSKLFPSAPPAAKFTSLIEKQFADCLTYVRCVVEGVSSSGRQLGMQDPFARTCRARIISFHGKVSLFPCKSLF